MLNRKPLVLNVLVGPLLLLSIAIPLVSWLYTAGLDVIGMIPGLEGLSASILDYVVIITSGVYALLSLPLAAPSNWRERWVCGLAIGLNLIGIAMWLNLLTVSADGIIDFIISLIVVTFAMMFNIATSVKFIRE